MSSGRRWCEVIRCVSIASRKMRNPLVEIVVPDGCVPLRGTALELLTTPDVVDQHVDMSVPIADAIGERPHLMRVEMVNRRGNAGATEAGDQLSCLFDCFRPVVLGAT